jgi:UDP-N-acetylglucosamine--N-acetylmuramyl-(pentapeptide) pyrophosphoryl-undecaprenol N-acetylglucosamine transferase
MNVLLAAGGTGGHLFPAAALASALQARGIAVDLATDDRALKYGGDFPARAIHAIPSATPTSAGLPAKLAAAATLARGVLSALMLLRRLKPAVVVGFGGYPTVPPLVAASLLGVPSILHEQNAVMGRANRFLSRRVSLIATGFPDLGGVSPGLKAKLRYTGNPVRLAVLAAAATPYPDFADGRLRVLVTGGSQGARVMSEVVPAALAKLAAEERARISLTLQARGEDRAKAADECQRLGFSAEIAEFFPDLPARIAGAHLVVARAGASTVSELAVIGRPAILVPYPHALDQDQAANAAMLAKSGAAIVVRQADFTPDALAQIWREAAADPTALRARAETARRSGVPDAAERLVELVREIAQA